jgi:integrase
MKGHIKERSPGRWAIVLDITDAATGLRKRKWHSYKGNKREAQAECARLITSIKAGAYVEATRLSVGDYILDRLAQWEGGKKITALTAQTYRELAINHIIPHLGNIRLQKLKRADIENWHTTLIAKGRKDGEGGLSARMVGHCHRVLSKALKEAMRFDLVIKNVASTERPPKVDAEEVQIVAADKLKDMLDSLKGQKLYPLAILALFCGLRRGEIAALKWQHIDFNHVEIDPETKIKIPRPRLMVREAVEETKAHGIRIKPPKSKAGRRDITMPDIVVETLREHRRAQLELRLKLGLGKLGDDDLLFPTIDGKRRATRAAWRGLAHPVPFSGFR